MAKIGPVRLAVEPKGVEAKVEVAYDITFDDFDQKSNQPYVEVCRLVGDDTVAGDPPDAAPDETIGFMTPLFFRSTRSDGKPSISRKFTKTFRMRDLDEDRGTVPDPDEIRAVVTITPVVPSASARESNLVELNKPPEEPAEPTPPGPPTPAPPPPGGPPPA